MGYTTWNTSPRRDPQIQTNNHCTEFNKAEKRRKKERNKKGRSSDFPECGGCERRCPIGIPEILSSLSLRGKKGIKRGREIRLPSSLGFRVAKPFFFFFLREKKGG
jgi:hypothetical protein